MQEEVPQAKIFQSRNQRLICLIGFTLIAAMLSMSFAFAAGGTGGAAATGNIENGIKTGHHDCCHPACRRRVFCMERVSRIVRRRARHGTGQKEHADCRGGIGTGLPGPSRGHADRRLVQPLQQLDVLSEARQFRRYTTAARRQRIQQSWPACSSGGSIHSAKELTNGVEKEAPRFAVDRNAGGIFPPLHASGLPC